MKILYFAQAAEQARCREEAWEMEAAMTQGEFWAELEKRHPGLADLRPLCRLACNCEYLEPAGVIQPGDEVAIIPPVSGG